MSRIVSSFQWATFWCWSIYVEKVVMKCYSSQISGFWIFEKWEGNHPHNKLPIPPINHTKLVETVPCTQPHTEFFWFLTIQRLGIWGECPPRGISSADVGTPTKRPKRMTRTKRTTRTISHSLDIGGCSYDVRTHAEQTEALRAFFFGGGLLIWRATSVISVGKFERTPNMKGKWLTWKMKPVRAQILRNLRWDPIWRILRIVEWWGE